MKEKTQYMFRRVQIRFVIITMSIILAIFIAVLGSVNVIMQTVMQKQSQSVLKKIATNIEYNEKTSVFSFVPQGEHVPEPTGEKWELYPQQTTQTSQTTQISETTETQTTTNAVQTTETQSPPEISEEEIQTEQSDENTPEYQTENPPEPQPEDTEPESSSEYPTEEITEPQPEIPSEAYTEPQYPDYPYIPDCPPPWDYKPDYPPDDNNNDYNNDYNHYRPQRPENFYPHFPQNYDNENSDDENLENLSFSGYDILSEYYVLSSVSDFQKKHINDIPPKTIDSIDYFVIMADTSGKFLDIFNNDEIENSLAQRYIDSILDDGAVSGMIESFQFCKSQKTNGTVFVFTDKSAEMNMLDRLIKTTILIGSVSFILLSVLVVFLSRKSIEPVQKAFEKQKQFISDASHELKTPLTIISANADVLAGEIGDNKWLNYIQSQAYRMSLLVNDLLNLTRLENNSADMTFSEFNLSQAVLNTALPFECQAFEAHKIFNVDVEKNITIVASERHCKQLFAIFIDNAIKHSDENGEIKVSLKKSGDKKIFSVYNTGSGIRDDEKEKIFERFYRSDDSRSRSTGGYGLGLAIAKSIIDYHKFKLSVENIQGKYIKFIITMS